jgi:cysteine dioxygenase
VNQTLMPLAKQDATANPPKVLVPLFREIDRHGASLNIEKLDAALRAFQVSREDLAEAIKIDVGGYVRTLVRKTEHYEMLVMAWLPGQRSPIHDHLGSACAVRVVAGHGIEQRYELSAEGYAQPTTRHEYPAGLVACSVDTDVHAFGNAVACPAPPSEILVTIHIYAPPLAPTKKYSTAASEDSWSI